MRIALLLIVLIGSAFAQYQQYPEFYASPSKTWINEQVDTTNFIVESSREKEGINKYNFYLSNRPDSLINITYLFINNRLQQKKLSFIFRGDLETSFKIVNKHNGELLWKYVKNSYTTNPADSGKFRSLFAQDQILTSLKDGGSYQTFFGLANDDMISLKLWYESSGNYLIAELRFISNELYKARIPD